MNAVIAMQRFKFVLVWVGLATGASYAFGPLDHRPPNGPALNGNVAMNAAALKDQEQIIEHIHGLFKAYLHKDREAIHRGHTADWRGFQVRSGHIVRGIDEYIPTTIRPLRALSQLVTPPRVHPDEWTSSRLSLIRGTAFSISAHPTPLGSCGMTLALTSLPSTLTRPFVAQYMDRPVAVSIQVT